MNFPKLPCALQMGTVVYRRLDTEAVPGMVVGVQFNAGGSVLYDVAWANDSTNSSGRHYEIEITTTKAFAIEEPEPEESVT